MKLFSALLIMLFFTACQKDETTTKASGNIKSITFFDPDETTIYSYEYDASNRVTKLNVRFEEITLNPVEISTETTIFYYQGSDEKPVKDSVYNKHYAYKSIFNYDNQGRVIKKESFSPNGALYERDIIEYGANTITTKYYKDIYVTGTFSLTDYSTAFIDANSNCTEIKWYSSANVLRLKQTYAYDNKPNPLALLNINKYLNRYSAHDDFFVSLHVARSPNNMTIKTDEIFGSSPIKEAMTTTYQYNTDNFPTNAIAIIKDASPNSQEYTFNVKYVYY